MARAGAAGVAAGIAAAALLVIVSQRYSLGHSQERLQVMYIKEFSLADQPPLQMLVCPPESAHCGYGGVDTSEEAYNNPDPLAIINEHCTAENRSVREALFRAQSMYVNIGG